MRSQAATVGLCTIRSQNSGMLRVSIVSTVSNMPSCRTSRFARDGFQLPCRARRVVSQRCVSRVSHVSRVSRHGEPAGIDLMQKHSGRTWHAVSGQVVVSAVSSMSAVSGQTPCQPCRASHVLCTRLFIVCIGGRCGSDLCRVGLRHS